MEVDTMKRLKMYLSVRNENVTFKEMYEGRLYVIPRDKGVKPYNTDEPTYWEQEISYRVSKSNRIELSKPTVLIGIPITKLKISEKLVSGETKLSYRGIPAADYCLRRFANYIDRLNEEIENRKRPAKENGMFYVYHPDGKVLERNCAYFSKQSPKYYRNSSGITGVELPADPENIWYLNLMIMVQLPEGKVKKGVQMMTDMLPNLVKRYIEEFNLNEMKQAIQLYNKQEEIRTWLKDSPYCAFVADGSILPRQKDTDEPMEQAKRFTSIRTQRVQIGQMTGLGIRKGVTVITGGGYSGKSTLLDAISEGIYNHKGGDGREYVITDLTAMKISAEDGRSVKNVNISPFIRWVPNGDTKNFSTEHASGSTSQAANIVEAVSYGSKLLLIDEDKSATNFMIRDSFMQQLVPNEPIIPYTDRVQELSKQQEVSTVLVIGGSSEYLKVCDQVIMMDQFIPVDVTKQAREIVCNQAMIQPAKQVEWNYHRTLITTKFLSYPEGLTTEHLRISEQRFLEIGDECIDTRMIHNIASMAQLNAIAFIIRKIENTNKNRRMNLENAVDQVLYQLKYAPLDSLHTGFFVECPRWMELPRKSEILAVVNRMRKIQFQLDDPIK